MLIDKAMGQVPAELLEIVFFKKGSSIYFEGDRAHYWYQVMRGTVRTCRFYADGHRQLTNFFYRGDVFGLDEKHYRETAEAVTDVRIRRRSRLGAEDEGHQFEEAALRRALASAQRCIFLLGHKTAEQRLAAFLVASVDPDDPTRSVILPMPRSDIADHLGLTIHTVSRTLSDMARRGLIKVNRRQFLRITDMAGLRALSGGDESSDSNGFGGHETLVTEGLA